MSVKIQGIYLNQDEIIKKNEKKIIGDNRFNKSSFNYLDYWIDCLYYKKEQRIVFSRIYKKNPDKLKSKYKLSEILNCNIYESHHFNQRFRKRIAFFFYEKRKKAFIKNLKDGSLYFVRSKDNVYYYQIKIKKIIVPLEFHPEEDLVILESVWKNKRLKKRK